MRRCERAGERRRRGRPHNRLQLEAECPFRVSYLLNNGRGHVSETEEGFGARVRRLREAKEIGLRPFARMIGISATYLPKTERDELPPPAETRVKQIARLLDE